jgi:hypothetical protein
MGKILDPPLKTIMKTLTNLQGGKHNKILYPKKIKLKHHYSAQTLITHTQTTQNPNNTPKLVHMYPKKNLIKKIAIINRTPTICKTKIKTVIQTKTEKPSYTFHNKTTLLKCGNIESNPGPKNTLLLNHPQIHQERQKTYFYNKTTQIKPEYYHIFEIFKPYLNYTQPTNINLHLTQFCRNNNHCPKNYLFYAILITLAHTPTQCNQLIAENSTQWTTNLIKKFTYH